MRSERGTIVTDDYEVPESAGVPVLDGVPQQEIADQPEDERPDELGYLDAAAAEDLVQRLVQLGFVEPLDREGGEV